MKDKIIAKFKAKFPAVTLSTKRMDEIADRLSKKVTNEDEIDTKLDEMNELHPFADIQKSDDQIRDLKSKVKNSTQNQNSDTSNQSGSTTKKEGEEGNNDSGVGQLAQELKQMREELAQMRKNEFQQAIQQKVSGHEKLKGIPTVFYKGRSLPEKEEDLETFVDGIKTDYDTFRQETNNEGLVNGHKPANGSSGANNKKVSPLFAEVMEANKKQAESQNKN